MKRLWLEGGRQLSVRRSNQGFLVHLGDKELYLELEVGGSRATVGLADGSRLSVLFCRLERGVWQLHVAGRTWRVRFAEPQLGGRERVQGRTDEEVRAPIPGRVVEVLAAVGAELSPGAPVLVLEAMKMQNLITAQRGGRLAKLLVAPGARVEMGQLLAVVQGD